MAGRLTGPVLLAVATCAFAGCEGTGAAGRWAGQVDTLPDGLVLVRNPDAPLWDSTTAWRLEEELRIGSVEGAGPDVFAYMAGVLVDSGGRIWVVDRQAKDVRIFGADGVHIRTFGREGAGPGEFRDPIGLALAPTGEVWVVDPGNARYSIHDSTGAFLETRRRPVGGYSVPWRGGFEADGGLWEAAVASAERGVRRVLLRYDDELQPRDTLFLPAVEKAESFELRTESGSMSADVPFTPDLVWARGTDGSLWFASSGEYRLYRTESGDTVRIVERPFEPVPVTDEDRREAVERLDWFVRQGGRIDGSKIPSTKPILQRFSVDPEGRLWVLVREPGDEPGYPFDVFDPDGRYLGRIRSPVGLYPNPIFHGDAVYGIHSDELGVQRVVRLRLRRPSG